MKICFVVNAVDETSVPADIATALVRYESIDVDVLAWFRADEFEDEELVEVACLDAPETATGIDRRTWGRARDVVGEYDIVQVHHNHSGSFAKLIARLEGVPVVSREGNTRDGFTRKGRTANGMTNALADRVVCNSPAVLESFKRWERLILPDDRITIIPNGLDFERVASALEIEWEPPEDVDDESVLVGTAGLLTEQKAHDTLLRAIERASSEGGPKLELVVAGDGPLAEELKLLAVSLGIDDRVHFVGRLDRAAVYRMLDTIDVYAMPSRWEGFSAAAVEAMGVGAPCVFSDIDPFLEPYEGYALFHPVDDADALADRLTTFASDPGLRRDYAERGRELVRERYSMGEIARQYRELYETVVDSH